MLVRDIVLRVLVRLPSASDLSSQLVGNSGIRSRGLGDQIYCGSVGSTVPEYRSVVRISHKLTGNDFAARRTGPQVVLLMCGTNDLYYRNSKGVGFNASAS